MLSYSRKQRYVTSKETPTNESRLTRAQARARVLLAQQLVVPSQPALLYFEDNHASVVWYWATVIAGAIPALLPPLKASSITQTRFLDHISQLLKRPPVLTSKVFVDTLRESKDAFSVIAVEDLTLEAPPKTASSLKDPGQGHEHEPATLLFTSGSTGPSKAVEFTHHQLIASSQTKALANNMSHDKVFLSWISFDHSVSICELHLHAMFAGADQVMIPASEMIGNPAGFWTAVSVHQIAYTFAPNSFLATANAAYENNTEEALDKLDFSHLETLFCGGEANKVKTLEKTDTILSRHRAQPHSITPVYGLSETCSAIFYNRQAPQYDVSQQYIFASVGSMLPGNNVRLVNDKSAEVKRGDVGAVQLEGPLIFKRYYNDEAATSQCMTEDGWFDTGDTGRFDEAGNLCIVGRTKEVLIINGQNYSSFDLEYAVERAVVGLTSGYTATFSVWLEETDAETEDLVILFSPEDRYAADKVAMGEFVDQVTDAAITFCGKRPAVIIPLPKHCLPKSSIGKLSRSQLKRSLLAGEFDTYKVQSLQPEISTNTKSESDLTDELRKAVQQVLRNTTTTFDSYTKLASLGIDSLSHIRLKSAIEHEVYPHEVKLSLARLVQCRTLGDVDRYLAHVLTAGSGYDPIVELAPQGSKPTLILGHPGNGEPLVWYPLVPYFPDRRILALRARGFEEGEVPFTSLEEAVDEYLAAIKKREPSGPYCFFGRCFSGLIVYELARRLEAQGDEVLFCGNVDLTANVSDYLKSQPYEEKVPVLTLLSYLKLIEPEKAKEWSAELAHLDKKGFEDAVLQRLPTLKKSGLSPAKMRRWMSVLSSLYYMARGWTPQGRLTALDVFYMRAPAETGIDDKTWHDEWISKWNDHVVQDPGETVWPVPGKPAGSGPLRFHYLPTRPEEADDPAFLPTFGAILSQCLSKREEERSVRLGECKSEQDCVTIG
jgi:acyl-CoA synthetase (AMP-forming)/AMP-acid ligase II/thioesterase domain-containing protein